MHQLQGFVIERRICATPQVKSTPPLHNNTINQLLTIRRLIQADWDTVPNDSRQDEKVTIRITQHIQQEERGAGKVTVSNYEWLI